MNYLKRPKLPYLAVALCVLFSSCDNSLMELDPINEVVLEEVSDANGFDFTELVEMTDFSNMREGDFTGRFIIISKSQNLPNNLERSIQNAGGEIVKTFPEIGVAIAVARKGDFYEKAGQINGIESITADMILKYTEEPEMASEDVVMNSSGGQVSSGPGTPFNYQRAFFDGYQWAPASINAPDAWEAGVTGEGIRVAVLDGGFHSTHMDLAPNLDFNYSTSTVPTYSWNEDTGTFWHGTHVAGIVAAAGNGIVGIAPKATIIGVKTLHSGSGAFEWILEGILYAARPISEGGAGAQVINMSLGATFDQRGNWGSKGFRDAFRNLQKSYDRATRYAYQNGVTVIAAAGNGATNLDEANGLFKLPAQNQHVISISSTGPTGWGFGNDNFSQFAYYSDFGKSLVDFAAPGGTVGLAIIDGNFDPCRIVGTNTSSVNTCAVFDQVFSTIRGTTNGNYGWAQGTSMAAPAAAGVVALMIEANGGHMTPAQVGAKLRQTSTDLGKPGNDEFYGHGFVNAAKAAGVYK